MTGSTDHPVNLGLWSGFTRRLMAVLLGAGLLVGGLLTGISIWKQKSQWKDFIRLRGNTLARSLGRAAFVPLLLEDTSALDTFTEGFSGEQYVSYVALYDASGKLISQRPRERSLPLDHPPQELTERRISSPGRADEWDFILPLRYLAGPNGVQGTDLSGFVRIGLTEEQVNREVRALALNSLAVGGGIMLAAFFSGAVLIQRMTGQMRNFIEKVQVAEALRESEEKIRALNVSLQDRATQLEASNKELEAFSYSVSHDLRAPLRSIDGFSQVLLEDFAEKLGADGRDHLSRVRAASQRMAELIDDMLTLSRLARQEMAREDVDLSGMARAVLEDLGRNEPGRKVETVVAPGLATKADRKLLRAVLENLLGNAWKFTSKKDAARIEMGSAPGEGGATVFFIKDNGAGFNMAYAHKLFGVFQRLHAAEDFSGTGVGLATVQRVVQRHGGRVWAESIPGEGATFYFTLPHAA